MSKFFRDNWIWIVAPIVVVLVAIVLFYWLSDDPGVSPFQYPAF